MPAYDYRCPSCSTAFEVVRAITEREDVACPACGVIAKRLFTPVGVVFKGSGFHNTDNRPRPKNEESSPAGKDSCGDSSGTGACSTCPAASAPAGD